jgi:hypothetical protein
VANPRYCRATWVNIAYIIFHELTGINVIMLYSNQMFNQMASSNPNSLSPRKGTYLVGIVNLLSSLLSTQVVKCFGRRTLVIWGHLGMAITHALVGYFSYIGMDIGVLIGILVFLLVY